MGFKNYYDNINEAKFTKLFKLGQSKKQKSEFRMEFEKESKYSIPEKIEWNNPADFTNKYNRIVNKYKKQIKHMYPIYDKGSGGPGEMLMAYLCDDILLSDKQNIDLKTPSGYIEMKAVSNLGKRGTVGTFNLGVKYAPIEKKMMKEIDKILDYIKITNKSSILDRDWVAISKLNLNKSTIPVMEITSFNTSKSFFETKIMKNGNILYNNEIITNINDKNAITDLKNLISQPSNIKPYNDIISDASKGFEQVSTPFFFIGSEGSSEEYKLVYYHKLTNIKLNNYDQNGPKYYMELS